MRFEPDISHRFVSVADQVKVKEGATREGYLRRKKAFIYAISFLACSVSGSAILLSKNTVVQMACVSALRKELDSRMCPRKAMESSFSGTMPL